MSKKDEMRARVKMLLLEVLTDNDTTTNDLMINKFYPMLQEVVKKELVAAKEQMMLEIAMKLGEIVLIAGREDRKPLWERRAEELGLNPNDLEYKGMGKR